MRSGEFVLSRPFRFVKFSRFHVRMKDVFSSGLITLKILRKVKVFFKCHKKVEEIQKFYNNTYVTDTGIMRFL